MNITQALRGSGKARRGCWANNVYVYWDGSELVMHDVRGAIISYVIDKFAFTAIDWSPFKFSKCKACKDADMIQETNDGADYAILVGCHLRIYHCSCKEG